MAHKETRRQNTIDEIKSYARQQIETVGPAGLSMSAVARAMEISTPALYRYFDSRDELVRSLIGDATDIFVAALQKTAHQQPSSEFTRQFWAVSMEYRQWSLAHPIDFGLIFYKPYFNDLALWTGTQNGIQRIFKVFLDIIWDAYRAGNLKPLLEDARLLEDVDFEHFQTADQQESLIPAEVRYTAHVAFSRIHGLLMLEMSQGSAIQEKTFSRIYLQELEFLLKNVFLDLNKLPAKQKPRSGQLTFQRVAPRQSEELHVIFGSGPLGLAVMTELVKRGKQVRMVSFSGGKAAVPEGVEWLVGDALQVDFTRKACQNAAVVYQCTQPSYSLLLDKFAALNGAILDGAAAKGAKFIYGDNLLMYGSVDVPVHEGMANKPQTRKGQFCARVSEAVLTAHRSGRVRAALGRGSDFYGPNVLDSILGERYFTPLILGKTVPVIGDPDIPHTFTYIEDFGKALVELGDREEALGQIWHVPNPPTLTQRQLLELFYREIGLPLKIRGSGRGTLALIGLFVPDAKEKAEVLYQFEKPFIVDSTKFERTFGITATPLSETVQRTVKWYREYLKSTGVESA